MSSLPKPLGQPWFRLIFYCESSAFDYSQRTMKLNSTVTLTFILLLLMLGAGLISAAWGFALGHEALKGITQPDLRPTNDLATSNGNSPRRKGQTLLREADILAKVQARMQGKVQSTPKSGQKSAVNVEYQSASIGKPSPAGKPVSSSAFPITSHDRGITFSVRSVRQQGGSLSLEVSLKNEGTQPVRFLYSFLNVTDERGRAISASTEGLPGELPANGELFSGVISIPTALLDNAKRLSMTLTDYPNQQLQLQASGIPVPR